MVLKNTVVAPWHSPEEGANDPSLGPSVGRRAGLGWGCRGDPNLVARHATQHPLAKQSGEGLLLLLCLFIKGDDPLHPLPLLFFVLLLLLSFPFKGEGLLFLLLFPPCLPLEGDEPLHLLLLVFLLLLFLPRLPLKWDNLMLLLAPVWGDLWGSPRLLFFPGHCISCM